MWIKREQIFFLSLDVRVGEWGVEANENEEKQARRLRGLAMHLYIFLVP